MSDIACHCGKRGALFARNDGSHKLLRWHHCREHLDSERVQHEGLVNSTVPPATPPIFLDTDINRLHPKIKDALNWSPRGDVSGLLLHGTTGVGKTRGIWEIIKRLWSAETLNDRQLQYEFLTMRKLETVIEKGFKEQHHGTALEYLITVPLLVLDDLGKERLTQRMASDLFAVIDERSTSRRSTIISTNFNGSSLLDRFDSRDRELGVALVRRLKDYYSVVGVA